MKLRVVFQGGGARLVTLLAAASALEKLRDNFQVEIEEIGGVSAGAIAACALASPGGVEKFRQKLVSQGQAFLESQKRLSQISAVRSGKFGSTISAWTLLDHLAKGNTIVDAREFENFLAELFGSGRSGALTLSELKIPTTIFSSNVATGAPITYSSSSTGNERVSAAAFRSASVPFIFSSFGASHVETDGGICGNLPVKYFLERPGSDARVLAFSFPPEQRNCSDVVSYGLALLASAMESSVREAVEKTIKAGGVVCELKSEYGTFEFEKALAHAQNNHRFENDSRNLVDTIRPKLDELFGGTKVFIRNKRDVDPVYPDLTYQNLKQSFPYEVEESTLLVIQQEAREIARCYSIIDEIVFRVEYTALSTGFLVLSMGLPYGIAGLPGLKCDVSLADGTLVNSRTEVIATELPDGRYENRALIFLERYVNAADGPLTAYLRFEGNLLPCLRANGWDYNRTKSSTPNKTTPETWLMAVGRQYPLKLEDLAKVQFTDAQRAEIPDIDAAIANWSAGAPIPSADVKRRLGKEYKGHLKHDAHFYGWHVPALAPGSWCGFFFRVINPP